MRFKDFLENANEWGELEETSEYQGRKVTLNKPFYTPNDPKYTNQCICKKSRWNDIQPLLLNHINCLFLLTHSLLIKINKLLLLAPLILD